MNAKLKNDQSGFAIIESVVSAAIIAVVFIATLNSLDVSSRASQAGKDRSIAAALAADDQSRQRRLGATSVTGLLAGDSRLVNAGSNRYRVVSTAFYVSSLAEVASCSSSDASSIRASFIKITSTVTKVNKATGADEAHPAATVVSSYFLPILSSTAAGQGEIAVIVKKANGEPIADANLTLTRTGYTPKSLATNEQGCALFTQMTAGKWLLTGPSGWYGVNGTSPATENVDVNIGELALINLPLSMTVETVDACFDTATPTGVTGSSGATVQLGPSGGCGTQPTGLLSDGATPTVGPVVVYHPKLTGGTFPPYRFFSSPSLTQLFPFTDVSYSVWAGRCAGIAPTSNAPGPDAGQPIPTVGIWPGSPTMSSAIRLPTLVLFIEQYTSTGRTIPADVMVRVRSAATRCSSSPEWVQLKGKTLSTDGANPAGTIGTPLPYGPYEVCVKLQGSPENTSVYVLGRTDAPFGSIALANRTLTSKNGLYLPVVLALTKDSDDNPDNNVNTLCGPNDWTTQSAATATPYDF